MSKINQIQTAILSLDPGAYQKLMDSYVMKKYGFSNIMPLGSHSGTNKVTKGTPDSFVQCADGRFILIAHGSVENHAYNKVKADILSLHRKEVISIFDDKAVKFENQNLRDYLLYYAFFKEKWLWVHA